MADEPSLSGEEGEAPYSPRPLGSKGTILLVEDETNVRILIAKVLEHQGYTVIEAPNGAEALERGLGYSLPIHLLITDVTMPLLGGVELVRQILPLRPSMKVIFITGRDKKDVPWGPAISFLEKPFTLKALPPTWRSSPFRPTRQIESYEEFFEVGAPTSRLPIVGRDRRRFAGLPFFKDGASALGAAG